MDPLKVIIDNWPSGTWPKHIPTAIAVFALIISIASLYWGRKQFESSTRPYVYFLDRSDPDGKPTPQAILFFVSNSPAQIKKITYDFYYPNGKEKVGFHQYKQDNLVKFPNTSTRSEWIYVVGDFDEKLHKIPTTVTLKRKIRIDYSFLSGNGNFFYESEAEYNSKEKTWKTISERAK